MKKFFITTISLSLIIVAIIYLNNNNNALVEVTVQESKKTYNSRVPAALSRPIVYNKKEKKIKEIVRKKNEVKKIKAYAYEVGKYTSENIKKEVKEMYMEQSTLPLNLRLLDKSEGDIVKNKFSIQEEVSLLNEDTNSFIKIFPTKTMGIVNDSNMTAKVAIFQEESKIDSNVYGELYNDSNKLVKKITFKKDEDGNYNALVINGVKDKLKEGTYTLKGTAQLDDEKLHFVIFYSLNMSYASFNKNISDNLDNEGNLVFDLEFDIFQSGTYKIEAYIETQSSDIATYFEKIIDLNEGINNINIDIYGYLFYSKKISGPIKLKSVALSKINSYSKPMYTQAINANYTTKNYEWSEFNKNPYDNKLIKEKIKML